MQNKPSFIAFTGVDESSFIDGMQNLSRRYPIEWGILLSAEKEGTPLFPKAEIVAEILSAPGLRFAAHVCGDHAGKIANDPDNADVDITGFQRVQVNHSFSGSSAEQIENTIRFGRAKGVRAMLQSLEEFPDDRRLDWLFDTSFGTGKAPTSWPALPKDGPFCGFSGGIKPDNVTTILDIINPGPDSQYWIDMESGVRTNDRFDLEKCEQVCRAVYG